MIRRALIIMVMGLSLSGCDALNAADTALNGLRLPGDIATRK